MFTLCCSSNLNLAGHRCHIYITLERCAIYPALTYLTQLSLKKLINVKGFVINCSNLELTQLIGDGLMQY